MKHRIFVKESFCSRLMLVFFTRSVLKSKNVFCGATKTYQKEKLMFITSELIVLTPPLPIHCTSIGPFYLSYIYRLNIFIARIQVSRNQHCCHPFNVDLYLHQREGDILVCTEIPERTSAMSDSYTISARAVFSAPDKVRHTYTHRHGRLEEIRNFVFASSHNIY